MASTSATTPAINGDGTLKKSQIAEHLRARIVGGELLPGAQLPTRVELEQQFGVSTVTVQRALDFLVANEFVRVNGRRGTFVVQNPPHLSRYALVMSEHPVHEFRVWGRFALALCDEVKRLERDEDVQIAAFVGAQPHGDNEIFQKAVREVEGNRLAGLIFLNPGAYLDTPLMQDSHVARVGVGVNMKAVEGTSAINLDWATFWDRSLEFFAASGRKKLAVLATGEWEEDAFIQKAAQRGIEIKPQWVQYVHSSPSQAARRAVHLLLSGNERPDALLVSDDNLLESATQGILDAKATTQVEVVSHCNFPYPTPSLLPVKRLGFDLRAVLKMCLQNIDAQQRGEIVGSDTSVTACFDDEI